MAKPAKSLLERKISLIDDQEYLSEKEKKKAKEEAEKTEKIKASKKEETGKILEEEQKEFEKAAEKSAALEEKKRYLSPRDSAKKEMSDSVARKAGVTEDVFEKIERDYYESRKKEEEKEEKRWENFGKEFENVLKESSDYVTEKQSQGKIVSPQKGYGSRDEWYSQSDDDFVARYNAAEDYVMSEGETAFENVVKGMFNNTRSTLGKMAGKAEFFLGDNITGYKAGENAYPNNDPWYISDMAEKQFNVAKESAGDLGDKIIDAANVFSKELGYGIFGFKSADWFRNADIGFTEYENLRRNGVSKEEALFESAKKAGFSFAEDKLWDKSGDLFLSHIPKGRAYGVKADFETNTLPKSSSKTTLEDFFGEKKEITEVEYEEILQFKNCEYKINIQSGVSCFPENDLLYRNVQNVKPIKYKKTNEICFDIGMHGNPKNVAFSSAKDAPVMTPKALAVAISKNTNYRKGQPVRLLSCSTGREIPFDDCFAQKLANEINAPVVAPTDVLYIKNGGQFKIGEEGMGKWRDFQPKYSVNNEIDSYWRIVERLNRK